MRRDGLRLRQCLDASLSRLETCYLLSYFSRPLSSSRERVLHYNLATGESFELGVRGGGPDDFEPGSS